MSEREHAWYIYTTHDFTNEVISRELPPENALRDQMCSDHKRRNLWRCDSSFVDRLLKSQQPIQYEVFIQEGNGAIRWRPWPPKRKKHKLKPASELAHA